MSSSIGSVSSSQYQNYQTDNSKDQFKQDMQAIQTALQSGDVTGAQDAFSKLKDLQQQRESKKGAQNNGSNGSNPMQKDMQSLQNALSSGNLQDAQNAFAQLQTDMKAHGGHHGHHMQSANGTSSTAQSTPTTDSSAQTQTTATDVISGASPMYA